MIVLVISATVKKYPDKKQLMGERGSFQLTNPIYSQILWESQAKNLELVTSHLHIYCQGQREMDECMLTCLPSALFFHFYTVQNPLTWD